MHPRPRIAALLAITAMLLATAACAAQTKPEDLEIVRVPQDAATLADAADRVAPGGMILLAPGVYEEELLLDTPDVTVRGEDRNRTVIDGGGIRPYGVVAMADGIRVENLTVTGATFYGVLFTGLHDESGPSAPTANGYEQWDPSRFPPLQRFLVDHVTVYNNGLYGIYAFNAHDGVIRDSYASGSADSGFYVGQCRECGILVTGNIAERNAVGFENANASDSVVVAGNRFAGNRIGMTLLSSYQEAFTPQRANDIVGNLLIDNTASDSPAQAEGAFATGVGISGGQQNMFLRNRIAGNPRAGVILSNTEDIPSSGNSFDGDVFESNGVDIANISAERTPASGNCAPAGLTSAPAQLAAQLEAACAGAADAEASTASLTDPAAPAGVSFLRVAPPRDQPNLPQRAEYPRLPDTVAMPDLALFTVPDPSFLAERAGTR
ncbi:MAG: right-handed parallel beta-helix repeat-containing protein [Actinomycetota bacterium]|nr:right-handed parallel beta-helix repeat-containing protein [Actinomycetota bacterium]